MCQLSHIHSCTVSRQLLIERTTKAAPVVMLPLLVVVLQSDTNASGWPAHQRQLDAWLAAFAAAYEAEQQLLGEEGAWPNIAAGKDICCVRVLWHAQDTLDVQ